jgi:hypothetical protein
MRYNIFEYFKYFLNLVYLLLSLSIFQAKKYSTDNEFFTLYGISQNPDTNDYILVQNNTINLINWISGNEKIDELIQEKQLKINKNDVIFEWISYNQFNKIEKTGSNYNMTVYSAIWKDGPLQYYEYNDNYRRNPNKKIALKYLHTSKNPIEFVISEV